MIFAKLCVCLMVLNLVSAKDNFKTVYQWKEVEFEFPSEDDKQYAIDNQHYVKGSSFVIDADVFYKVNGNPKIFITTPRFDTGRPMTLGVITKQTGPGGPIIKPYPDYSWHENQGTNCDGMTSVLRVAIDECSRLWVLDTGKLNEQQVCPPQLLAFDLNTDKLLHRHKFTQPFVKQSSLFVTPVVDVRNPNEGCSNTFVYIADVTGFQIIVFDLANDKSWRTENKLLYPHPSQGTFTIAGESFELMDGVLGMALSPFKNKADDRVLYFHSLASVTENMVRTSVIRNSSSWDTFPSANPRDFVQLPMSRTSQSAAQAIDRNGIMYFGLATPTAIACWDTSKPYSPFNIDLVAQDQEKFQFASGVKIVNNAKKEQELWVVTCRFQKIMTGSMVNTEVNYRVMAANVKDLVMGTKCNRPITTPVNNKITSGGYN